jgi:hypothetical protein
MIPRCMTVGGLCALFAALPFTTGCSPTSAGMTGGRMLYNVGRSGSHIKLYLDGQEGKQNPLKKAWQGPKGTRFVIKEPISPSPTFRYTLEDPAKFGRINTVQFQIHQEFEGDFSHLAEYVVASKDNQPESHLKPDTEYKLAELHQDFRVFNHRGDPVERIVLDPGKQYRIVLTVAADRSETLLVEFKIQ